MNQSRYTTIVVKVGTGVITKEDGKINEDAMHHLVSQIMKLRSEGVHTILVSSGAVASGRDVLTMSDEKDRVLCRQVYAAVGQVHLIQRYEGLFRKGGQLCAQVLPTKEDFRTRRHFLNIKNCFEGLLREGVTPIVNENDVISVHELMFTDNDELAGLIAAMMNADALILLTNVDGVYTGSPTDAAASVIPVIDPDWEGWKLFVSDERSTVGRGGMLSKCHIAKKLSKMGIETHIVNGGRENVLLSILHGENPGTLFTPRDRMTSAKRWIGICEGQEKGTVYINAGAAKALADPGKASSLLPIGIVSLEGDFRKGDIIKVCTDSGVELGMGMAQYDFEEAKELIGKKNAKPLVHYDYLYLSV